MTKISPETVIDASAYVKDTLTTSKRLALMALATKWRRVDPANVRGTLEPLLPEIEQLMHEQQALGRQIGWTQGELAAAVATGEEPGSISLPLDAARDGRLRGGPSFANALQRAVPGALARIKSGVRPDAAVADAGRMVALQLGSIAHDEARLVTQDLVLARGGGAAPRMGYARKPEGAHTCDFCRTLATRGPVYSADTAGFRAHRFCDCTTYAVPTESFEVDPNDWAAYQRWASSAARQSVRNTKTGQAALEPVDRLTVVNAQIASYEPIVKAGNGTYWMRGRLDELYEERTQLAGSSPVKVPNGLHRIDPRTLDANTVRSHPFLSKEIPDLPEGTPFSNPERRLARNLAAHHYYYDPDERVGVVVSAHHKIKPEHFRDFNQTALNAARQARADLVNPDAVIVFDLETPVTGGAYAATRLGASRVKVNRGILRWTDPKAAARATARNPYGNHYSISIRANSSVEATLLHELGHDGDATFVGAALGETTGFQQRKIDLYKKWAFGAVDPDDKDTIRAIEEFAVYGGQSEQLRYLKAITDGPTLYGRSNPSEMYAEAYAAWRMRDRLDLPPETLRWAEEFAKEFQWN